jgi:tRNA-splicing ligase RtcB (3'-phosphate/5'-hydroxy nucleic acid ligase)
MVTRVTMPADTQTGQRIPAHFWGDPTTLEDSAREQALRLTTLEFAVHAAFMPDVHHGYGFPIGTVFASKDVIVPYGVGNDIGCGMIAGLTNLTLARCPRERLQLALQAALVTVPSGGGRGQGNFDADQSYADWTDVDLIPEVAGAAAAKAGARIQRALEKPLGGLSRASQNARRQFGTLGSGNHFLEYQADELDRVWLMIHSGSRGLGGAVCTFYDQLAALVTEQWYSTAGRKKNDLAFLPVDSFEGQSYRAAMDTCLDFARKNRAAMLTAGLLALGADLVGDAINVHHNLASLEHHLGLNLWVHRKGATRARAGEIVAIPGSMETGSYICEGLGNALSLESSSHGAGRAMSRTAARKLRSHRQVQDDLASAGILIASPNLGDVHEEGGHGYKDIELIMDAQSDLVRPLHRLRPLAVLKG